MEKIDKIIPFEEMNKLREEKGLSLFNKEQYSKYCEEMNKKLNQM